MNPIISVHNLGKCYRLGHTAGPNTLRDRLAHGFTDLFSRRSRKPAEEFWALKDVSFEVQEGEVLGIIGRNGAGKSTLLKILSQITEPTTGEVRVRGRIASLLEVGTGFHGELSGRENIYLNGAILGMAKAEIRRKFDEIVSFSGIEKFIDTPVKRYSSGMTVRLAFAVAAHLEPEIMLIDEVLAVGDIEFQKKCLGKMGDVAKSGRTILFVSHNMAAIRNLCSRVVFLENGLICTIGETASVIEEYIRNSEHIDNPIKSFEYDETKSFQLEEVRLVDEIGVPTMNFDCDHSVTLQCVYKVRETVPGLYGYATVNQMDGTIILESDSFDAPPNILDNLPPGRSIFTIRIPARTLAPGEYQVYMNFTSPKHITGFNVDSPGIVGQFHLEDHGTQRGSRRRGYFSTRLEWQS